MIIKKDEHPFLGNNRQIALIWYRRPPKRNLSKDWSTLQLIEEARKLYFNNCLIQTDVIQDIGVSLSYNITTSI